MDNCQHCLIHHHYPGNFLIEDGDQCANKFESHTLSLSQASPRPSLSVSSWSLFAIFGQLSVNKFQLKASFLVTMGLFETMVVSL